MDPRQTQPEETFMERQQRLAREGAGRLSPWMRRARAGALFGYDKDGKPLGKDHTGLVVAA